MKRRTFLKGLAGGLVTAAAPTGVWARVADAATNPVRVYVVIIDGLRADEVDLMPQLSALVAEGTFYPQSRAEMVAETSPNHMSLLTGMRATRHGMPGNAVPTLPIRVSDEPRYAKADSILTLMRRQAPDMVSAAIGAKTYVADLSRHDRTGDGEHDVTYHYQAALPVTLDSAPDEEIGAEAVRVSRELDPDFLWVNLGDVDRVGHSDETGGATDGQAPLGRTTTLQRADAQVRLLVESLKEDEHWEQTVLIVTADHSMDWSFRDRGRNLAPAFEGDELLAGQVRAAINGGASLYALRHPDEPLAPQRLARMRALAVEMDGVRDALYIRPNPVDGGEQHWVGRVYPQWGLGGDHAGDFIVTMEDGWRIGHHPSDPHGAFSNPIPGNHGHPVTLPIPIVVSGGWSGVQHQHIEPPADLAVTDEHPSQARNIDIVPTAAWLLGLNPPPGGYDGRVLTEAFGSRPSPRTAVRNVASMPHVGRVFGDNRFTTAVALSELAHPDGAGAVVMASGLDFADALAATPWAIELGAPILLATPDGVPAAVLEEVARLEPDTAYIVGGTGALGPQVEADLEAAGVGDIVRVGGTNRFDTARLIAEEVGVDADGPQVVLATGLDFADALASGPVAAAGHPRMPDPPTATPLAELTAGGGVPPRPLLLTLPDRVPDETRQALEDLGVERIIIAGGPRAVSTAVEEQLRADGMLVERIAGADRYATGALLVERGVREGAFTDEVYLVTGGDFPDALAAGAAVGRLGGSLIVTPPGRLADAPATRDLLHRRADEFVHVTIVGGDRALSSQLADDVVGLIRERRTRA